MGPYLEGGLQWCYNGLIRIQSYGPILEDWDLVWIFAVPTPPPKVPSQSILLEAY